LLILYCSNKINYVAVFRGGVSCDGGRRLHVSASTWPSVHPVNRRCTWKIDVASYKPLVVEKNQDAIKATLYQCSCIAAVGIDNCMLQQILHSVDKRDMCTWRRIWQFTVTLPTTNQVWLSRFKWCGSGLLSGVQWLVASLDVG